MIHQKQFDRVKGKRRGNFIITDSGQNWGTGHIYL